MRLLKTLGPALMALLVIGVVATPVAAQTPAADEFDVNDLEGIQKAYARYYTADMMAMFNPATPDAQPSGWFALTAMVLEFDNEDNATAANARLLEVFETSDITGTSAAMDDAELDVDVDYTAKLATLEEGGMTTSVLVATAQDGAYIYAVIGVTFGEDPSGVAGSMLTTMTDTDTSDDEETFHEDGTSTGGLWAKLPTLEQVRQDVPALIEAADEIGYPAPEGTPAA